MQHTDVATFSVVSENADGALETVVRHHVSAEGYELFSITQRDVGSDEYITVLLHRDQLASLANIAKGH